MRFLADMGLSMTVVEWLRSLGHDIVHLRDEGLQRLPNGVIFKKVIAEKRIVITFDLDFSEIAAQAGESITSVIIFRLKNTRSTNVIDRLEKGLPETESSLQDGAIIMIENALYRSRHFPIF